MRSTVNLSIESEQNLSLAAKIMLILNRKQVQVTNAVLSVDTPKSVYRHTLVVRGEAGNIQKAVNVIAKQIGVLWAHAGINEHTKNETKKQLVTF